MVISRLVVLSQKNRTIKVLKEAKNNFKFKKRLFKTKNSFSFRTQLAKAKRPESSTYVVLFLKSSWMSAVGPNMSIGNDWGKRKA
jgi:hypothetical protein